MHLPRTPFVSVPAILAVLLSIASAAGPAKSFAVFDRLDATTASDAPNWSIVQTGGSATLAPIPSPSNKSVELKRTKMSGEVSSVRKFAPLSGRVIFEARVMTSDTKGVKLLPVILDSKDRAAATIAFDGGDIVLSDGSEKKTAQSFNPGEWYVIRGEIDTKSGTYDLYVDAILKAGGAKLQSAVADIAKAKFALDSSGDQACFDNLIVYDQSAYIGTSPAPVLDVAKFGAVPDGKTNNTAAIQKAIDQCAGTGGSVYVPPGVFVSGTLMLKSKMTFFIAPGATLLGSSQDDDYPEIKHSAEGNTTNGKYKKAFLRADHAKDLMIDGGGTIDGNGAIPEWKMNGTEEKRPFLILPVRCENLTVQNVHLKDAAMWCFVPTECDGVTIRNLTIDSRDFGNRDGIDVVDCHNVLIEHCTLNTDDDGICPKSGIRSGITNMTVRDVNIAGSLRASGIKFGTDSYGQLKHVLFENIMIKNTDKAAIGLEAVDGADISDVICRNINITNTNSPFYLIIGHRCRVPRGDVKKIGSVTDVTYEDITARNLKTDLGCPISGLVFNGKTYPLKNLTFRRCDMEFKGGISDIPMTPPEMGEQYPECNVWGPMPAYGYFIRHAENVQFIDCKTSVSPNDTRKPMVTIDVNGLSQK